ncbi:hypothetical protein [Caulobacter soli]|uniref:hypothetical protein n=1 Tax=Caulobacter soli TaxID=2708539 RepID=UPI0013ED9DAD|nr:hypothetical protein [Caulobacter soli]
MLLAIDEVVNMNPDSTVVLHGMTGNVFDLLERLRETDPLKAFAGFFGPPGFHFVAPSTQAATPPASFVAATKLFPRDGQTCMAMWPEDTPDLPAHKQALVQASAVQDGGSFPPAAWIFVVSPDGGLVMTAVQLLTYMALGGPGQGLPVGTDRSLIGVAPQFQFPGPDQQPPNLNHALRITSWRLPAGTFDLAGWYLINRPLSRPVIDAPAAWGEAATQTILLATTSPGRSVHWINEHGRSSPDGFFPSSPILHVTFLVGATITIKRSWERDFKARLVDTVPTAAPAWWAAQMMLMQVLFAAIADDAPWPVGALSDRYFDELGRVLDKDGALPVPHWLAG